MTHLLLVQLVVFAFAFSTLSGCGGVDDDYSIEALQHELDSECVLMSRVLHRSRNVKAQLNKEQR